MKPVGWTDLHSRCSTSRRSESIFRRLFNCSINPTHKQSSITQTTALDWSDLGLDNKYHTAVDVKVSRGRLSSSTFFFQRPGSDAQHICSGGLRLRHTVKVLEMSEMSRQPHVPVEPLEGTDETQGRCSCYALTLLRGLGRNFASRK